MSAYGDYVDEDAAANAAYWRSAAEAARQQEANRKRIMALKGQTVWVARGRKVPIGTTGTCFWVGEGNYGWRIGFKDSDGDVYWTALSNVEWEGD